MAGNISISPLLFQRCFQQAWSSSRQARVKHGSAKYGQKPDDSDILGLPQKFGIAVSGGADSMALAYLCKQLEGSADVAGAISVTAFVVDHLARPDSTREAQKVAGWLRDMDIKTHILSLDWSEITPNKNNSSKPGASKTLPSAFETHARRLRFQALGVACHALKLETLLLGHHQDDNIETTLWRLATGATGLGLGGISEVARIPECHGVFGASESWSTTSVCTKPPTKPQIRVRFNDKNHGRITFHKEATSDPSLNLTSDIKVASPGIFICRPLLSFTKASLLETCHKNQIPYVSDPTNFDPTLTPRNAIRSMRTSNSLPKALESPSILSLIRSSKSLLQRSTDLSNTLLSTQCHLLDFNPKAGSLTLQILPQTPASIDPALATLSPSQTHQLQTLVLRRITELISPFPDSHFSLRTYEPLVANIFPNIEHNPNQTPKWRFTHAGVLFQRLLPDPSTPHHPPTDNIWLLSRQPFMRERSPITDIRVSPSGSFTPWTLWDNRFWMRLRLLPSDAGCDLSGLRHLTHVPLTIRPFSKLDIERMRRDEVNSLSNGRKKDLERDRRRVGSLEHLKGVFAAEAPSQLRFTLPVLAREGMNSRPGKGLDLKVREQLALPTLEYRLAGHGAEYDSLSEVELVHLQTRWKLKWQWMYKMIDTEALRLMGWPVATDAEDT